MAQNTTVAINIKANAKEAEQSVGSIKKQLREAQADVLKLSEKFGATSKEATEAAKRAAQLKDAIGDAKALTDAFSPDAKFNAFAGALNGVVSGFSALQGAQALFGTESKELEATLLKVQAAMALSQGLNGILGAKDAFVNLAAVVKTQVVASFGTLRAALISTGIGALVVAVGLLITNFEKVKQAIINIIPGAEGFFNLIGDITDAVTGWFGANEDVIDSQKALKDATDELTNALGPYYSEIERVARVEQLRARIAGATIKDGDLEVTQLQRKIELNKNLIAQADKIGAGEAARLTLLPEIKKLEDQLTEARLKQQASAADAARKAAEDAAKQRAAAAQKAAEEKAKADELQRKSLQDLAKSNSQLIGNIGNINRKIAEDTKQVLADQVEGTKQKLEEDAANRSAINASIVSSGAARLDQIQQQNELEKQSELDKLNVIGGAANTFADIIGRQTAAGKALAIAGALINTYKGASEVIGAKTTLPEPFGTIQKIASVASIIATGIKQVRAITSVKVPGAGGGGGAATPSAPAPVLPQAATTQLDQGSINQIGNAAGRAFVLETDVTNNQERVRRLNRAARIN